MNRGEFINELENRIRLSREKCSLVCDVFERYVFWKEKNREKIIDDLMTEIDISKDEASDIYEKVLGIIGDGVKNSILHPFRSKD